MAGMQVNTSKVGDLNITNHLEQMDATRQGHHKISLTNWGSTAVPAIASGSKIEVNGALFKFTSDEAIGGSPSDGNVYIKLIPDEGLVTAEFTNTAPTWDTQKGGWYQPGTNNRYLNFTMHKSGSSYLNKKEIPNSPRLLCQGDLDSVYIADASGLGVLIRTLVVNWTGGPWSTEFYILKPMVVFVYSTGGGGGTGYVTDHGGLLLPGHYRLWFQAGAGYQIDIKQNNQWTTLKSGRPDWVPPFPNTGEVYLYMTSCFGVYSGNSFSELSKIITVLS